tara:strand:+ start:135 stop:1469 length:1335 start_codon:yes stop_codon:yes gene_type:complete
MNNRKFIYLGLAVSILTGCMESYPEQGKYEGTAFNTQFASKYAKVYSLNSAEFKEWKVEVAKYEKLSQDKESLLTVREKFATSELVRTLFKDNPFLAKQSFNFKAHLETKSQEIQDETKVLERQISNLQNHIENLQKQKAKESSAKAALEQKKVELEEKILKLEASYNQLKAQASQIFTTFNPTDYGVRSNISSKVLDGKFFDYHTLSDNRVSCKDSMISGRKYKQKRYDAYVFAAPVTINNDTYCPYFKTPGSNSNHRAALRANLSEADLNIIRLASSANVSYIEGRYSIKKDIRNISKNNPDLAEQARSFKRSDENQLRRMLSQQKELEDLKLKLENVDLDELQTELLKELAESLSSAQPLYLYSELEKTISPISDIQPDGIFTLDKGQDYHLVVFDPAEKKRPQSVQFSLIRMAQYEDQKLVTINNDSFFNYAQLRAINLQ